jgi:hypothetical protein
VGLTFTVRPWQAWVCRPLHRKTRSEGTGARGTACAHPGEGQRRHRPSAGSDGAHAPGRQPGTGKADPPRPGGWARRAGRVNALCCCSAGQPVPGVRLWPLAASQSSEWEKDSGGAEHHQGDTGMVTVSARTYGLAPPGVRGPADSDLLSDRDGPVRVEDRPGVRHQERRSCRRERPTGAALAASSGPLIAGACGLDRAWSANGWPSSPAPGDGRRQAWRHEVAGPRHGAVVGVVNTMIRFASSNPCPVNVAVWVVSEVPHRRTVDCAGGWPQPLATAAKAWLGAGATLFDACSSRTRPHSSRLSVAPAHADKWVDLLGKGRNWRPARTAGPLSVDLERALGRRPALPQT